MREINFDQVDTVVEKSSFENFLNLKEILRSMPMPRLRSRREILSLQKKKGGGKISNRIKINHIGSQLSLLNRIWSNNYKRYISDTDRG